MRKRKYNLFKKGDVIRTNPEHGFYGIAVVLSVPEKIEIAPGKWSYPMCHIAVTPHIFQYEVNMDEIEALDLKPLVFQEFFQRKDGVRIPWRIKPCVDIYTNRNKVNLPVIGNIDPTDIYSEPLLFEAHEDGYHLCGDVTLYLGRPAYISWLREKGIQP